MITLSEKQQQVFDTLVVACSEIEEELATSVNPNEPQDLQNQIEKLRPHLAYVSTMLSSAGSIYDYAKGQCARQIMNDPKLVEMKAGIQKMYIEGELNKFNELYIRVENTTKSLKSSIDGLVSLLSFEKEKIKNLIHHD